MQGAALALGVLALLALTSRRTPLRSTTTQPAWDAEQQAAIALVAEEARRQGVPPALALTMAELESSFRPKAEGDKAWARKRPADYQRAVVNNPHLANNPARLDPDAWHAYGLFQLLAPYHVGPEEHPRVLLEPETNAKRGVTLIARLLRQSPDPERVRLGYTGALGLSREKQEAVLSKFRPVYARWRQLA